MRNLKRALSLALASVMLVGMMVVGTSAASYPDVDAGKHDIEAIDVLEAIGVMKGDAGTGNFRPDDKVSRNEMAVVMARLILGNYEADSYTGTHPFTDVPSWADRYVAACYSAGIINGTSATTYSGTNNVTAVQAAAMMLRALGYEDLSLGADRWDIPVAAKANQINLFDGMSGNGSAQLTRNDIAKLSLNTLKATMVDTVRDGQDITLSDGTKFYAARRYELRVTNYGWKDAIDDEGDTSGGSNRGGYIQLGEYLYKGDLKLEDTTDKFGRPGNTWTYKGGEICDTVNEATYTYTDKVTGKSLYNTLGKTTVETYTWTVKTDGKSGTVTPVGGGKGYQQLVDEKDNKDDAFAGTGKGVLTEVFVNGSDKEVVMTITNTYAATVTRVKANDGKYDVTVRYEVGDAGYSTASFEKTVTVDGNDFAVDDIVLLTVADDEIQTIKAAESVTGEVDAVKGSDYIKLDGKQYDKAVTYANIASNPTDDTMPSVGTKNTVVYLDAYGNMIAVDAKSTTVEDYVYITDDSKGLGGLSAEAVFSDGTKKDIKVTKIDTNGDGTYDKKGGALNNNDAKGKVWTYAEDDGEYSLKKVTTVGDTTNTSGEIKKGSSKVTLSDGSATTVAGSKTVFVNVDDGVAYTGYADVPSFDSATLIGVETGSIAEIIFITAGTNSTENSFWFFVKSDSAEITKSGSNTFREYTVYTKDGEEKLTTKNLTLSKNFIYKADSVDSEDRLTAVKATGVDSTTDLCDDLDGTNTANVNVAKDGVLKLKNSSNYYADSANKTDFTYNKEKSVFLVVDANDVGDGAETVGIGSDKDIDTATSIVYILSVDDKSDATPLATLVLVVNPYQDTTPPSGPKTWTANVTSLSGGTSVKAIMVSGTVKTINTDFATTFGTEQTVGNYKVSYDSNTLTFTGKDNTITSAPTVYYSTAEAVSKSNTSNGTNAVAAAASVTLTTAGDTVTVGGSTVSYDSTSANAAAADSTDGTVSYTVTVDNTSGKKVTVAMTAKTAGVSGNDIVYTGKVDGTGIAANTKLTGGAAAAGAKADYALGSWTSGTKAIIEGTVYTSTGNIGTDLGSLAKSGLTFTYAGSTITATTTTTGSTAQHSAIALTVYASVTQLSVTEVTE